ncbi:hypothetical protein ONZ45_g3639 [Pleurotus djamor]|nr:hypothetical protein ONZ45_g17041 [Pleurotus djamor]KAJ8519411.1 hypothetical protein ONZ45_g3639 [Pleurotus djamor]
MQGLPEEPAPAPSDPNPRDTIYSLTPPIGTVFWKRVPFQWISSRDDVGRAEWNVEIYVYVSSARPDDPQFTAKGGRITVLMVHSGYFETTQTVRKGLKFMHNILSSANPVYRAQFPPDWSGEVIGDIKDERRRYRIGYKESLPMFNNGGNDQFTFDAAYNNEYDRKNTTQGGSNITGGLVFDVTANVELSRGTNIPIHAFSVFNYSTVSAFPVTYTMRIGYGQVELPPDIHPLPESITPYFVYPYTLEPHILTLESSRRNTMASHAARREAYLQSREEEKARRKREALRRIAPGFEPEGAPLVPTKRDSLALSLGVHGESQGNPKSLMDDLVDQLAALDAAASSRSSTM